jgi:hypothetical protein
MIFGKMGGDESNKNNGIKCHIMLNSGHVLRLIGLFTQHYIKGYRIIL